MKKIALLVLTALVATGCARKAQDVTLLNVSYDPTRELYADYNNAFAAHWKATTGQNVRIDQSHGGSGKQARSVIDGLAADVVTLGLAGDVDAAGHQGQAAISRLGVTPAQTTAHPTPRPSCSWFAMATRRTSMTGATWRAMASTVVTPNPKTSGGARWNYLAAWAWALKQPGGSDETAKEFLRKLYHNAPVLDTGARQALTTFAQRDIGDVFVSWENEAFLATRELGPDKFEIVVPSVSILAEPSVAVVDQVVLKKGTRAVAQEYLKYLYSPEGTGNHRQALLPSARSAGGGQIRQPVPGHHPADHQGFRRLGEGAEGAVRGWRRVRSAAGALISSAGVRLVGSFDEHDPSRRLMVRLISARRSLTRSRHRELAMARFTGERDLMRRMVILSSSSPADMGTLISFMRPAQGRWETTSRSELRDDLVDGDQVHDAGCSIFRVQSSCCGDSPRNCRAACQRRHRRTIAVTVTGRCAARAWRHTGRSLAS